MDFIPIGESEKKEMLDIIKVNSTDELFFDIPEKIKIRSLKLPNGLSEADLKKKMTTLADSNKKYRCSFLGAGSYNHYVPSVVNHLANRSEFYTAYTPYQAEMSQGILQAIFEYQTMICRLTGMDVANASLYDGAESVAEAAVICTNKAGRNEVIISKSVHPEYRQTVKTYLDARGKTLIEVDFGLDGKSDIEKIKIAINEKTAGVIIQSPNFFGFLEDIKGLSELVHSNGSLMVVSISDPTCLGTIVPPGQLGADIVCAEGQSFGNPRSYGGPYLGIIAVKEQLIRNIPGRLVGQTVDKEGRKGYILTLQAREQHIRRENASCNICSNEALVALRATIYLAAIGKTGMKELAEQNFHKTNYLKNELLRLGLKLKFNLNDLTYNEFVIDLESKIKMEKIVLALENNGIQAGLRLGWLFPDMPACMLFCVTEMVTKEDMDKVVRIIANG